MVSQGLGIATTGLVRLCAFLLIVSIIGPWDALQAHQGSDWVNLVYLGEGLWAERDPMAGWPWILAPLSAVVLFIIVLGPLRVDPELRRAAMTVAATWFALTALVLLAATDVVAASLGLGDWTGYGLGGFEPLPQPQPTGVRIEGAERHHRGATLGGARNGGGERGWPGGPPLGGSSRA